MGKGKKKTSTTYHLAEIIPENKYALRTSVRNGKCDLLRKKRKERTSTSNATCELHLKKKENPGSEKEWLLKNYCLILFLHPLRRKRSYGKRGESLLDTKKRGEGGLSLFSKRLEKERAPVSSLNSTYSAHSRTSLILQEVEEGTSSTEKKKLSREA